MLKQSSEEVERVWKELGGTPMTHSRRGFCSGSGGGRPWSWRLYYLLRVGQPAAAAPNQGDVVVTVVSAGSIHNKHSQTASPFHRESRKKLVIQEGKLAYRLTVTVTLLNSSTSYCITTDTSAVAITAALLDTRLPAQPVIREGVVYSGEESSDDKPLRMPIVPFFSWQQVFGWQERAIQHHNTIGSFIPIRKKL